MNKAMFFLILLILHLFIAKLEEISAKETASQQATKRVTKVKQTYINLFEQTIGGITYSVQENPQTKKFRISRSH